MQTGLPRALLNFVNRLLHFEVSGESEEIPFPRKGIAPGAALLALSR